MKKIILFMFLLISSLSLTACDKVEEVRFTGLNIFKENEILLGNKVQRLEVLDNTGSVLVVDYNVKFYDLYKSINNFSFNSKNMISCSGEMQIEGNTKSFINMNIYNDEVSSLIQFATKKENEEEVATIEEYSYSENIDGVSNIRQYAKYLFKKEKAFGGSVASKDEHYILASNTYPLQPKNDTELCDMQVRSANFRTALFTLGELFPVYYSFENNGETYDFNDHIVSKFELYENYIVFEQDNPFLGVKYSAGRDMYIEYQRALSLRLTNKVRAYYNINTGAFDYISIDGQQFNNVSAKKMDLIAEIYVHEINNEEYSNKVDLLTKYILKNTSKQ